jgi:signal transduction histidine kinase
MNTLEDLLEHLNQLQGKDRELAVHTRIHDFNNLLAIIGGFSSLLRADRKFGLPLETHDWAVSVDSGARRFQEGLELLGGVFDPDIISANLTAAYEAMIICPPEICLVNKKALGFYKQIVAAQKIFKQHAYTFLFLGEKPDEFDFREYLKIFQRAFSHKFKERDITLVDKIPSGELVTSELYATTLGNLIGNALKHAAADCNKITVFCLESSFSYVVAVENDGSNILSKEDYSKIFIPGYRRGEIIEGHWGRSQGIGLDSVKTQVEDYEGQIWVISPVEKLVEAEHGKKFQKADGVGFYFTVPKELVIK